MDCLKYTFEDFKNQINSLLIHPEGTRSRTGALGEFKQGAAQLAIKTKINVIPVCISGAYEIYPPNRKLPRFLIGNNLKDSQFELNLVNQSVL